MKLYSVKITDKKTNQIILDVQERNLTKKAVKTKYALKYRFNENPVKIIVERLTRKFGKQINLLEAIEEVTQTQLFA